MKPNPKGIKKKFECLKQLYNAIEKVRLRNELMYPTVDKGKVEQTRKKRMPVVITWPMMVNCPEVSEFVQCLERDGWNVREYDIQECNEILGRLDKIKSADFNMVKRLLTYFIRGERFCDGHWVKLIEAGFVKALIHRLDVLIENDTGNNITL